MMRGLTGSALLHGGLLAWALVSFHETKPFKLPEPEPVEVAIVSEGDIVRLRQGDRQSKLLEAQPQVKPSPEAQPLDAPKPKPPPPPPPAAAAPPPPPPDPPKVEPPPPKAETPKPPEPVKDPIAEQLAAAPPEPEGPSPEEIARKEAERRAEEERRRVEAQKKAEADKKRKDDLKKREDEKKRLAELKRKEEEKKKKEFDPGKIAALLDKTPEKRGAPPPSAATTNPATKAKGATAGAPEGQDSQLTASQRSMIGVMVRSRVAQCWNIDGGLEGMNKVVVEVDLRLDESGRLSGNPRVTNSNSSPLFRQLADSALRALKQCEPYDLPAELYKGGWDHMVLEFDPSRMVR